LSLDLLDEAGRQAGLVDLFYCYASVSQVRQEAITPDAGQAEIRLRRCQMKEASSRQPVKAFKHLNFMKVSGSYAGSHWSWRPDKLAALLDCPLGA
jgi:hypothetical protein